MAEYIEREALLKSFCNSCDGWCENTNCDCVNCKSEHRCDMVIEIAEAPAAYGSPVVNGRWEEADDGDGVVCSVCREDFCTIYLETERFNYCPNCGAEMRETEGNG